LVGVELIDLVDIQGEDRLRGSDRHQGRQQL
jgi:hypothetical protein